MFHNWLTNHLYPVIQTGGPRAEDENYGGTPYYMQDGFLPIQNAIARSFIQLKCNLQRNCSNGTLPDIIMQRFPYPPHTHDILLQGLEILIPFFLVLSFIYPCINSTRFITIEKERQLKETMKIIGLPSWLHWISWFVWIMMFLIISISLLVLLLKV